MGYVYLLNGCFVFLPGTNIHQVQPIHQAHGLDQIPLEVQMDAVVFTRLDAHVPRPHCLDATARGFDAHALLEHHQRLVPLADEPGVRLLDARRVGRDEEAWPDGVRVAVVHGCQVRCFGECVI